MVFKRTLRCFAAAALASGALVATPTAPAHAATAVTCEYMFMSWTGGFWADLRITNGGPVISGWTARWSVPEPTTLGNVWSATMSQPDPQHMVAVNLSYNGVIEPGQSVLFGWTASATSTSQPTDITVNDVAC
jgi:chitin-binding protein